LTKEGVGIRPDWTVDLNLAFGRNRVCNYARTIYKIRNRFSSIDQDVIKSVFVSVES